MKKNKTSFFIVLLITVVCVLGTLIPTVMNMNMGLNMGRNTAMLFDAKSNTEDKVDSAKLMEIFENRAKYIRTNQYELSLSENNQIAIEVPSTSEVSWIQEYFTKTMNLSVRDTSDEVVLSSDDFEKAVLYTDSSSVYIRLYFKSDKLAEVSETISAKETSTDRYLVVWTDFAKGDTYADEKEEDTPKYFAESSVTAKNETGYIQVSGQISETYTKQLVGLFNAGSADYTYTFNSNAFIGSYASLNSNKLLIGYGTLAGLVVVAVYAYLKYRKAGILMVAGVSLVYSVSLGFFTLVSGVVSIQSLIGLWAGLGALLVHEFYALKKTKLAALNGRGLASSLSIGYESITKSLLLSAVTFFVLGSIIYFVNIHFIRDFAMMLIIVALVLATVGLFVVRGITTSLGAGKNASVSSIGIDIVDYNEEVLEAAQAKENFLSNIDAKKWFKPVLALILIVILGGSVLFATQTININPDNRQNTVLVVNSTSDEVYLKVQAILSEKGISNGDYTYATGDAKSWYVFNGTDKKALIDENLLSIADATEVSATVTNLSSFDKVGSILNTTLVYVSLLVVILILAALFYTFGFAQAVFASGFVVGLSTLVLGSLASFGVSTIAITFAIAGVLISTSISFLHFTQLKEIMATRKISNDKELFSKAVFKLYSESSDILVGLAISLIVFTFSVFALNQFVFFAALPTAIATALLVALSVAIIEPVLVSTTYSVRKTKDNTKKTKKKKSEKEELTVIGIND